MVFVGDENSRPVVILYVSMKSPSVYKVRSLRLLFGTVENETLSLMPRPVDSERTLSYKKLGDARDMWHQYISDSPGQKQQYPNRILIFWGWRRGRIVIHRWTRCLSPRPTHTVQFQRWQAPSNTAIATAVVQSIIALIQERVSRRSIIFREANGAFLACPRFQSADAALNTNHTGPNSLHALMRDYRPERFGSPP